MRPKNSIKTDKPPKGVTARRVSQILIFPPPKKRLKFLPIVLFRRLKGMFLHNSFSHNRLEQNELDLPQAKFGFCVKPSVHKERRARVSDSKRCRSQKIELLNWPKETHNTEELNQSSKTFRLQAQFLGPELATELVQGRSRHKRHPSRKRAPAIYSVARLSQFRCELERVTGFGV